MSVHNVIAELEAASSTETLNLPGSMSVAGVTSATGGLVVGTGEGITTGIKNIVFFNGPTVAVPSITDHDVASVNVDVSSLSLGIALGDAVLGVGFTTALPTNCRFQGAYVSATDTVTLVFGSEGGSVTGANRSVNILIADIT